jgi:ubiquitin-conjugating enzyme E2 O
MTKVLKKKKLRKARKQAPLIAVQPGQTVVVETLSTSSVADVVWQVRECELSGSDSSVAND